MNGNKKIYFFNDYFRKYPKWVSGLAVVVFTVGILEVFLRFSDDYGFISYIMIFLYLLTFVYLIFQKTRKNAFFWVKKDQFKIKINDEVLEVDAKFLSDFYINKDILHIIRINRLDTFLVNHLREKDIKKMLDLMKIQQEQAANK